MASKKTQNIGPKVELHGNGVGGFTRGDIERRAKELAEIDNRMEITHADRAQARAEFLARELPDATTEDADTTQSLSRDPSDPMSDRGHQVPEVNEPDEETDLQRLALEGVEEAQHDQMTAARAIEEPFRSQPKKRLRQGPPPQERAEKRKE